MRSTLLTPREKYFKYGQKSIEIKGPVIGRYK